MTAPEGQAGAEEPASSDRSREASRAPWKTALWIFALLGVVFSPLLFVWFGFWGVFNLAGAPSPTPAENASTRAALWTCLAAQWVGIAAVWLSALRLRSLGGSKTGLIWSLLAGCSAAFGLMALWIASNSSIFL